MNRFGEVLREASASGRAVGAFTCYNVATAEAVISSAELHRAPVILLVSPGTLASPSTRRLLPALLAISRHSSTEVLVEVDHVTDVEAAREAISAGVDAVMADGSRMTLRDNIDYTYSVLEVATPEGVGLEAELGRIEGNEDSIQRASGGSLTDPSELAGFLAAAPVDCVAVAIGNAHGHYAGAPRLHWDLLEELRITADRPLSLHGAPGLPQPDVLRARRGGVVKFNVNTELRAAYFEASAVGLRRYRTGLDLHGLTQDIVTALRRVVDSRLEAFGWPQASS